MECGCVYARLVDLGSEIASASYCRGGAVNAMNDEESGAMAIAAETEIVTVSKTAAFRTYPRSRLQSVTAVSVAECLAKSSTHTRTDAAICPQTRNSKTYVFSRGTCHGCIQLSRH